MMLSLDLLCSQSLDVVQAETLKVPAVVEQLLDDYAQRYHALKAPRKLQWRKHLGTVKVFLLNLPLICLQQKAPERKSN
jgi:anaphase-promoting complex subunit 2